MAAEYLESTNPDPLVPNAAVGVLRDTAYPLSRAVIDVPGPLTAGPRHLSGGRLEPVPGVPFDRAEVWKSDHVSVPVVAVFAPAEDFRHLADRAAGQPV